MGEATGTATPYPFIGIALADFDAEFDSELSFHKGAEIIILSTKGHQGWWLGRLNEKQGLIPSTYVTARALRPAAVRADFTPEAPSELAVVAGDRVVVIDQGCTTEGWSLVIKCDTCAGSQGPGLVPTEWLSLAGLSESLDDFAAEAEVELGLKAGEQVWVVQDVTEAPCNRRSREESRARGSRRPPPRRACREVRHRGGAGRAAVAVRAAAHHCAKEGAQAGRDALGAAPAQAHAGGRPRRAGVA